MIDIKELRVGNWLIGKMGQTQVEPIDFKFEIMGMSANPIMITPEILEKCGFVYQRAYAGGQDEWAGYGYWNLIDFSFIGHRRGPYYFNRNRDWELKHLHQLQNLYSALTGKELNYQPITHS